MGQWQHRQLIRRVTPTEIASVPAPEPIPESPARDSRPVADPQLQLAQMRALADDAGNALAQFREIAERMKFGRDVTSNVDDAGRSLAAAMLAVLRGTAAESPRRCDACSGTGRVPLPSGSICAACKGSGVTT